MEILRFLHYKCAMPESLMRQHIIAPASEPPAQDDDQLPQIQHDWREFNKAPQGITYQSAIYSPLAFRKSDPRWVQHWLMNALGTPSCFYITGRIVK